jgi:energy-coupling factor transporter ATP-binding protein EcfA2
VASLLEVGTGFHAELTGRENIYLNGSLLGMRKKEIDRKFGEIVAFADVERFLDAPVKHYSSGMYTRLAFAVAAHLETEILLVDEVLAVGDSAFQKKCLGKMKDLTDAGRTVFFVSHNTQAISQLTRRCILLANGTRCLDGPTHEVLRSYVPAHSDASGDVISDASGDVVFEGTQHDKNSNYLLSSRIITSECNGFHRCCEPIVFKFMLHVGQPLRGMTFSFQILDSSQNPICHFWFCHINLPEGMRGGSIELICRVPRLRLYMGYYSLTTWFAHPRSKVLWNSEPGICPFKVTMEGMDREDYQWRHGDCVYLEDCSWDGPTYHY